MIRRRHAGPFGGSVFVCGCVPCPPRPSHPAGTRGVGGCCSHSSLSLSLAGRVVWTGGGEGARGAPHRGAALEGAGAAPFASRRTASAPDGNGGQHRRN